MADIILKDRLGVNQTYKGVEKVKLNTSDGGTQIFSKGDTLERIPIDLDFTGGDQTINAPEGYLVKSAIIRKPENLKPENIVKDVDIAGIVGTSEGGGGGNSSESDDTKYHTEPEHWVDDVCFWDIDGNLILNVPMSEVPSLKSLPTPPEYEGLTFVRWNYTLEQIRATEYPLDVGALYKPTDGKTHLKINIIESSYRTVVLSFQQTVDGGVSVDWGDGSAVETISGTGKVSVSHPYSAMGEYEITLSVADECIMTAGWGSSSSSERFVSALNYSYGNKYVTGIYFGDRVELTTYSCASMYNATHITLPLNITDIPSSAFNGSYKIGAIIVPDGVISIGSSAFSSTRNAYKNNCPKRFLVCCLPESIISIAEHAFNMTYFLTRFVVPKNITVLPNYMLTQQGRMRRIYLPKDKIVSISNYFGYFPVLRSSDLEDLSALSTIGNGFMSHVKGRGSYTIPPGVETIGNNAFENSGFCEIVIPESVTTIGTYFASYAQNLHRIILCGNNLTSIGSYALNMVSAYGLEVIFYSETPPSATIIKALMGGTSGQMAMSMYVPDNAISEYEAVLGTSANSYDIYPISEYRGTLPSPC